MTASLHAACGRVIPLDVVRWRAAPDEAERALLESVCDPVLDVGCGPGRIAAALAARGRLALGIDPSSHAAAEARRRGASVLQRSVFDPLPGEGRWATALLLDGNIGIGGDPHRLLRRVRDLLRPKGEAVVEVGPPGAATETLVVQLRPDGRAPSPPFAWAQVGADDLPRLASGAGLRVTSFDVRGGRWFARAAAP
jgi:SAM-dependent methyltransferase